MWSLSAWLSFGTTSIAVMTHCMTTATPLQISLRLLRSLSARRQKHRDGSAPRKRKCRAKVGSGPNWSMLDQIRVEHRMPFQPAKRRPTQSALVVVPTSLVAPPPRGSVDVMPKLTCFVASTSPVSPSSEINRYVVIVDIQSTFGRRDSSFQGRWLCPWRD